MHDTDDHLGAIDVAGLEADDLARTQTTAIAEREHEADLESAGHGQQPLGLVPAHDQGELLRLLQVVDLGGKIVPPVTSVPQQGRSAVTDNLIVSLMVDEGVA